MKHSSGETWFLLKTHGRGYGTCALRGRTDDVGGGAVDVHFGGSLCGTRGGAGPSLGADPWPHMASCGTVVK